MNIKIKFFIFFITLSLSFFYFDNIKIKYQDLTCNYKKNKVSKKNQKLFKHKTELNLKVYNEKFDDHIGGAQGINVYRNNDEKIVVLASGYYSGAEILDHKLNQINSVALPGTNDPLTLFADGIQYNKNLFFFTDFKGNQLLKVNLKKKKNETLLKKNLNMPIGIDRFEDDLIISDYNNNLIKIVSIKGKVKKKLRKLGRYCFDDPYDLKVKNNKVIFVDRKNKKILITDKTFKIISIIENHKSGDAYFLWPQHIDIDDQNRLYVMDTGDKLIKVFSLSDNQIIASLKHQYILDGSFRGIAVDHEGYIYLTGLKKMGLSEKDTGIVVFQPVNFNKVKK